MICLGIWVDKTKVRRARIIYGAHIVKNQDTQRRGVENYMVSDQAANRGIMAASLNLKQIWWTNSLHL